VYASAFLHLTTIIGGCNGQIPIIPGRIGGSSGLEKAASASGLFACRPRPTSVYFRR